MIKENKEKIVGTRIFIGSGYLLIDQPRILFDDINEIFVQLY